MHATTAKSEMVDVKQPHSYVQDDVSFYVLSGV